MRNLITNRTKKSKHRLDSNLNGLIPVPLVIEKMQKSAAINFFSNSTILCYLLRRKNTQQFIVC